MRVKALTLDWNCVIAVESGEPQGQSVMELIERHRSGAADVALTTVSASENLKGSKEFPASASQFRRRISDLGWDDVGLLLGPCVIGLSYSGMCKIVGGNFVAERDAIWRSIASTVPQKLPDGLSEQELRSSKYKKWRNVWCDVHTFWTHIDNGRDMFVTTNTKDFQSNLETLRPIGLREVAEPEVALASI